MIQSLIKSSKELNGGNNLTNTSNATPDINLIAKLISSISQPSKLNNISLSPALPNQQNLQQLLTQLNGLDYSSCGADKLNGLFNTQQLQVMFCFV